MKVLLVLEAVFSRTPDGRMWTPGVFTRSFFSRYLTVFSHVVVAARVREMVQVPPDYQLLDDPRITFAAIPWYHGLLGYLRHRRSVITALRGALTQAEAVILRVPSPLAGRLQPALNATGRPFAVEVVGDPWDVFAPGVLRHPLRPLLRWRLSREQRQLCAHACATAYVTQHTLQRRYPNTDHQSMHGYSDIELTDEQFAATPRLISTTPINPRLVCVGTMSQRYKGQDLLLRALASCRSDLPGLHLTLVGDGMERVRLEQLAVELAISDAVRFTGHLAERAAVLAELDQADVFVLPSRTEGLPRAMLEAMARAMPCLGTRVGGIPELLESDALVPSDDHQALAIALVSRLRDPAWLSAASARNLSLARTYHQDRLREQRERFYQMVHDRTARWTVT